jgi:phospholipase/carboxylesterase
MSTVNYLPCIEIEPTKNGEAIKANAAIIWLHGLGASGDDFAPIVPQLKLDDSLAIRFIFPHAPTRPITINGGMAMPAWYDFVINGVDREVNKNDLDQTTQSIMDLIQRELDRGVSSDHIIIAGFSQGGAIAYQVAMKWQTDTNGPLAGLMAMSTYIADESVVINSQMPKAFPIHIYHGDQDHVVPISLGLKAKELLENNGYTPDYSEYSMEHSVCVSQIRDIAYFIDHCLKA